MAPTVTVTGAPVQEYVLKVASRCNLACDHCYVYADPGQDWLRLPVVIEPATVRAAAARIAEHAQLHGQRQVSVILHGGEPLLVGAARLARILADLRSAIDPVAELQIHVQSNGIRLSPEFCEVLAEHDVKVGISLDGDELANDRHRKFANGAGSHRQVRQALALLRTPEYRALYGGLLCTVDLANDPIRVYRALLREAPPRIDFLLPHGTWDQPPARSTATDYADWLLAIFDCWSADGRPVPVRIFDSILALKAGRGSGTESLGPDADSVAVIETDGTWEQVDSLKVVSELAARTGLDVWQHSVDEVIGHNRDGREAELCATCRSCAVVDVCGGGLYAHRFGRGNGFDNPSVYCADLLHLIPRVESPHERTSFAAAREVQGLPDAELAELAGGRPSAGSLARLNDLQYALDRVLIAEVAKVAASADGAGVALWGRLAELERESPAAVRAVLGYPFVRVRIRHLLKNTVPQREGAPEVLAAVVAAVAVRAGTGAAVEVPVRQRTLVLPGIGTLDLAGLTGFEEAEVIAVEPGAAGFEVRSGRDRMPVRWEAGTEGPAGWTRVRTASNNPGLHLDDVNPDRGCFRHPVAPRLTEAAAERWLAALDLARELLRVNDSGLERAVGALVGVVTPMLVAPGRPARASSAREAFGAVALGDPEPAAATLAALLVRQVAWSTVVAVHEVCPLTTPEGNKSGRVPALAGLSARIATADWARVVGKSGTIDHLDPDNDRLGDELDRYHGWSEAGRVLLAGLRERAAR
jgi:uncharacterized protein